MNLWELTGVALRGAILFGCALIAVRLLGRARPALRRLVLVASLGAAVIAPLLSAMAPSWRLHAPRGLPALAPPIAEPLEEGHAAPAASSGAGTSIAALAPERPVFDAARAVLLAWGLGALVFGARAALGFVRARRLVGRAAAVEPEAWADAIAFAERSTGARARILASDEVDAPAVTGVIAPVVLVPRSADAWDEGRRRLVLVHELAHVRQLDCLAQAIAQVACTLHWFDPLAWLVARRLRLERELAADDSVVAAGARPSTYAEDLLAIAGVETPRRTVPSGALGMADPSDLGSRIASILAQARARGPVSRATRSVVLGLSAVATLAIACASPEGQPRPAGTGAATEASGSSSSRIPALQTVAEQEIERLAADWSAESAAIVVLDPATGEILASAGRADGAAGDVGIRKAWLPGSTLKPITIAAALEERAIVPSQRFDCAERDYGGKKLHNADDKNGTLDVTEILAVSSNVGVSRIFDELGAERFGRWLHRFHFGEFPGRDLAGAARGSIEEDRIEGGFAGAVVANGQRGIAASPLQMAAAYGAIAHDGIYVPPSLTRSSEHPTGERLISPETARTVRAMLDAAVNAERSTGGAARVDGVRIAGKTGTAPSDDEKKIYASFVGLLPAENTRWVIVVGAETPRDDATGGKVAAPVFARVAARALAIGR